MTLCIDQIRRVAGVSRSTVDKTLRLLKDKGVLAVDGYGPVPGVQGWRRVRYYRLCGTPEFPLPAEVVCARRGHDFEAGTWEAGQQANHCLTCTFTQSTKQTSLVVSLRQDPYSGKEDQKHLSLPEGSSVQYRSALLIRTRPQDQQQVPAAARWVPHLGTPPPWTAPVSPPAPVVVRKGPVGAVQRLAGRLGYNHRTRVLPGVQSPAEAVPLPGNAVSYCPPPQGGPVTNPFADPTLGALTRDTRLLYLGLYDLADDDGHVIADPRYLKAEIFRYDDDLNPDTITDMICTLMDAGKIHHIPGYLRLADPPQRAVHTPGALFDLPALTGPRTDPEEAFERFWNAFPRRQGKGAARKAFLGQCAKGVDPERIVTATVGYAQRCLLLSKEAQFIPHPATWLNQDRFDDDPEQAPAVRSKSDDAFKQNMSVVEYYRQQEERGQLPGGDWEDRR